MFFSSSIFVVGIWDSLHQDAEIFQFLDLVIIHRCLFCLDQNQAKTTLVSKQCGSKAVSPSHHNITFCLLKSFFFRVVRKVEDERDEEYEEHPHLLQMPRDWTSFSVREGGANKSNEFSEKFQTGGIITQL